MTQLLMIGSSELILIVAVVLLLFGGKKIPELMRGLGKGVRSFKDGMNETTNPTSEENLPKPDRTDGEEDDRQLH